MNKISIKREQSQAGLSFAEREKFRPQVKNKLLLLLALLMTAATGAWAQGAKHLITATHDGQTRSLEQPLPYATTVGELYEAVTGKSFSDLISTMSLLEMPLTGISSNNTSVVSIGELNGASTPVTVKADGQATVSLKFGNYAKGIYLSVTPPLYVTMKDGTQDADKWTVSTDGTTFGALPIGGLKGDGSETVTLKYNGRLKVKGVKATTDAAPASLIVNPAVGQVIGADGKNYADAAAATAANTTVVAVIAYVGSSTGDDDYTNGLAIALADEAQSNWSTAKSTCEGKTAITGAKWCLPSQDQWKQMFKANGGNEGSYTGLNTTITNAGGTILQEGANYRSSSEISPGVYAYSVGLDDGSAYWSYDFEDGDRQVRACLAF